MKKISGVSAREILDSRGNPTVEVDVTLSDGSFGRAAVPSGASTGSHEAVELRDGEKRYGGKGVLKALAHIEHELAPALVGASHDQSSLDEAMIALDGTANKGRLGANAILGISLAFARASATSDKMSLYKYFHSLSKTGQPMQIPVPMMNILNGGKHAENSTDIQEFMIMPIGASTFREALRYGAETFHALKKILAGMKLNTSVGDEGGYSPSLPSNEKAVEIILEAITKAGYTPGIDISIAIDAAASELYKDEKYDLATEKRKLSTDEMVEFWNTWIKKYPIVSIEDGFAEDDWSGYEKLTKTAGSRVQIVGDDLFVTNTERLKKGIAMGAANSILIKLNQIGTVTETLEAIETAHKAGYTAIISHRSGETEDTTISDFAVGTGVGQIKTGSLCRSERVAKYNQLLRIEEELGNDALFQGKNVFKHA